MHSKVYTSTRPTPLHRQWTFIARHCRWCSTSQLIDITYTPYSPLWGWMGNGYLDGGHACSGEHGCPSTGSHLSRLLFFFFSYSAQHQACAALAASHIPQLTCKYTAWEPLDPGHRLMKLETARRAPHQPRHTSPRSAIHTTRHVVQVPLLGLPSIPTGIFIRIQEPYAIK
jgi:hypothetical protein